MSNPADKVESEMDHDGLRESLDSMIALESQLEEALVWLSSETRSFLEAPAIIGHLYSLVTRQRQVLQSHLEELGDTAVPPPVAISALLESPLETGGGRDMFTQLEGIAAAFAQAAFRYAVLHGFAHRSYQVSTADLADQHRVNYLRAAQTIHQSVGDVVLEELQVAGQTCRCQCPSCSPGICLCWHAHAEGEVTGPGIPREGIVVREPRPDSNAEHAGLRQGDVILAVEGQGIGSYQDMLDRMREHEPGDEVHLRVRRSAGELEEVILTR
ncbi:MAG: PDZ domain-containing protein [Acidimicrobiia bacterium]